MHVFCWLLGSVRCEIWGSERLLQIWEIDMRGFCAFNKDSRDLGRFLGDLSIRLLLQLIGRLVVREKDRF